MNMKKIDYYIPLYENKLYHIYNRGNGNENIFYENDNYYYFLRLYDKYLSESVDTFAYCLLPDHFHLLVRIGIDNPETVSEHFRKFFISYSMSINKQEKRRGNLFQRGFKRKIIDDERYYYAAVYYLHKNPIHHGLVKDFREYKFSSYTSLAGSSKTKLCRDEVLTWFGGKKNFVDYHADRNRQTYSNDYLIEDA